MSDVIETRDIKSLSSLKSELEFVKNDFVLVKKELGDVAYQLSLLYDRWGAEHQIVSRREADMVRAIESFGEQVSQLADLEAEMEKNIKDATAKAAVKIAETVAEEVKRYFVATISDTVVKLSRETREIEKFTREYKAAHDASAIKTFVIGTVVIFFAGFLVGYFAF